MRVYGKYYNISHKEVDKMVKREQSKSKAEEDKEIAKAINIPLWKFKLRKWLFGYFR
jgi:hypothetical protein